MGDVGEYFSIGLSEMALSGALSCSVSDVGDVGDVGECFEGIWQHRRLSAYQKS